MVGDVDVSGRVDGQAVRREEAGARGHAGIGGGGATVAGDDVDDAGVVDQVDVMGCGIGYGDAVGPKRDAAGIREDRAGGGDVVRVGDGSLSNTN